MIKKLLLGLAILLTVVGCASTDNSVATISVTGNAVIELEPDVALFTVSAESVEATSEEARAKTSFMVNRAIDILKRDFNIEDKDIKTNYINISPYYEWQDNQRVLKGQSAGQSVDIILRDISKYGQIFTSLTKVDGISVSTASLDKIDKSADLLEVRKLAVKDAFEKANAYATAAGVEISGVLSIDSGSSSSYPRSNMYVKSAAFDSVETSNTEFYAGEIKLNESVHIVYTIK